MTSKHPVPSQWVVQKKVCFLSLSVSLSGTFEWYMSRLALPFVALDYANQTASSSLVPRFSVREVLDCLRLLSRNSFSDLLWSDSQFPRVIGFSLAS